MKIIVCFTVADVLDIIFFTYSLFHIIHIYGNVFVFSSFFSNYRNFSGTVIFSENKIIIFPKEYLSSTKTVTVHYIAMKMRAKPK